MKKINGQKIIIGRWQRGNGVGENAMPREARTVFAISTLIVIATVAAALSQFGGTASIGERVTIFETAIALLLLGCALVLAVLVSVVVVASVRRARRTPPTLTVIMGGKSRRSTRT